MPNDRRNEQKRRWRARQQELSGPSTAGLSSPGSAVDPLAALIEGNQSRPAWHSQAACRGLDPALFYPERGDTTAPAKRICAECPVAEECLDYAVENAERFGIWGGKSERERRTLRSQRRFRERKTA